jgi:toxin YoeB
MRDIQFTPDAFEQFTSWLVATKSIYNRLNKLIVESARTPFEGTGKP